MPKMGNYATVARTELELNPMQNDRVKEDYRSGVGKIGPTSNGSVFYLTKIGTPVFPITHGFEYSYREHISTCEVYPTVVIHPLGALQGFLGFIFPFRVLSFGLYYHPSSM